MNSILSLDEIERRLKSTEYSEATTHNAVVLHLQLREALLTAKRLGEWVENADHGEDAAELWKARKWLQGKEGA